MPSLGYSMRRYRIQLLIAALVTLAVFYYPGTRSQPAALNDDNAAVTGLNKLVQEHNPAPGAFHAAQGKLKKFSKIPKEKPKLAEMSEDEKQQQPQMIPNLRAQNPSNAHEFNKSRYEILTTGSGSARVNRKDTTNLPSVSVPRKEKFPPDNILGLPRAGAKHMRQVQTNIVENDVERNTRHERRDKVREVMKTSWNQYKKYAWGYDEIKPVSMKAINPFLGWAATMVDSLDTLLIMGLDEEYREAVEFVANIDFTATFRNDIPVFETVIRYLGGLIAAYDLNGRKDSVLLAKAEELGDNLMGAFDTPNRMPITFLKWQDSDTKLKYRAGTDASIAEVGTMTLEFTRLAQLTGNNTYYDAVARITNAVYDFAHRSAIPGLIPTGIDVSGCRVTLDDDAQAMQQLLSTDGSNNQKMEEQKRQNPDPAKEQENMRKNEKYSNKIKENVKRDAASDENKALQAKAHSEFLASFAHKMPSSGDSSVRTPVLVPTGRGNYRRGWCNPAPDMNPAAHAHPQQFGAGGGSDSAFEYFMKTYQLLKGSEPRYKDLYDGVSKAIRDNLVFRPKIESNHDEILMLGGRSVLSDGSFKDSYQMQHLTCFAGGMFALGGRLLGRPDDVKLGAQITQSCVWAYNATRSGVMPESFVMEACDNLDFDKPCTENTTTAGQNVDPTPSKSSKAKPDVSLVPDGHGGERWPVDGHYDQPRDMVKMSPSYQLRPEAIESVFYMYRVTGDSKWQEDGNRMFESIVNLTAVYSDGSQQAVGYSGVDDVTDNTPNRTYLDAAESFWMGETLKYAYLLFDDPDRISLDDYVFNTEAHPFKVDYYSA